MIKKLLSSLYKIFSYEYDRERIEKYLSQSENTYDLENGEQVKYGFFKKGSPIAVKGAIIFNTLIEKHKLQNKYAYIQDGEKIKFVHMIEPNPYQSSAFSFITTFPKELDILKYVDYSTQFEKSFIEPLKFICDKIHWAIDGSFGSQSSLEAFF